MRNTAFATAASAALAAAGLAFTTAAGAQGAFADAAPLATVSIARDAAAGVDADTSLARHLIREGGLVAEVRHERAVNSERDDFSPSFDGARVAFASERRPAAYRAVLRDRDNDAYFTSVFTAEVGEDLGLRAVAAVKGDLNDVFHDASPTFTADGQTVFYTRSQSRGARRIEGRDGVMHLGIYTAVLEGGKWSKPRLLSFCGPDHSDMHPTIDPEGTVMYFTSDREGGFGATDLYRVERVGETWGKPVNLGPQVNREHREAFPFLAADGALYYASDDPSGAGGYDVYLTRRTERGGYLIGETLPEPLNGPADDFGLVLREDGRTGYFASSREGGLGGDDLYGVTLKPASVRAPEGTIRAVAAGTADSVLSGVRVELRATGPALLPGDGLPERYRAVTEDDGTAALALDAGFDYAVVAALPGFDTLRAELSFDRETYTATVVLEPARAPEASVAPAAVLAPEASLASSGEDAAPGETPAEGFGLEEMTLAPEVVIELPNVFYDFDAAAIRPDAGADLDTVAAVLRRYPSLVIELRSHTDSRGTPAYNFGLSTARANAARDYLIARAIAPERLAVRGFGESLPKVACASDAACSEREHQLNRRTEIRVISGEGAAEVTVLGDVTEE